MTEETKAPDPALFRGRQIDKISAALAKAQGAFPEIKKNREVEVEMKSGGKYIFHYADLAEIFGATRPALSANELCLFQHTEVLPNGRDLLETILSHSSGQYLQSETTLPVAADMKTKGGNLTYEKRYQAQMMLGVAAEDDMDVKGLGEQGGNRQRQQSDRPPGKPQDAHKPAQERKPAASTGKPAAESKKEPSEAEQRMAALKSVTAASVTAGWQNEQVSRLVAERYKVDTVRKLSVAQLNELEKTLRTEQPPALPIGPDNPGYVSSGPAAEPSEFDKLPTPNLKGQ